MSEIMIYRLEVPYVKDDLIDTLDLYLEAGDESPCGESWVDTMEMIAEASTNGPVLLDAIKVIKNLGAPDEEGFGWQEYFPYLRNPHHHPNNIQSKVPASHPEHPEFEGLKVNLTWIRVFKPYLQSLRELADNLRFIKVEDKMQLVKLLKA